MMTDIEIHGKVCYQCKTKHTEEEIYSLDCIQAEFKINGQEYIFIKCKECKHYIYVNKKYLHKEAL